MVEGYISDKSFNETIAYPSDGRYFNIRLTRTSDVTNVRPTPVEGATVLLLSDASEEWAYEPSGGEPGVYELVDPSFKAVSGVSYKIQISTEEDVLESTWEKMPDTEVPPIGPIRFTETESEKYVVESSENVLRIIKEIEAHITVAQIQRAAPYIIDGSFHQCGFT